MTEEKNETTEETIETDQTIDDSPTVSLDEYQSQFIPIIEGGE